MVEIMTKSLVNADEMTAAQIAGLVDHTCLLRPEHFDVEARRHFAQGEAGGDAVALHAAGVDAFLAETARLAVAGLRPYAVCMYPDDLPKARAGLDFPSGAGPVWAAVVAFPHGDAFPPAARAARTREAIEEFGAQEIDTVLPYAALRSGDVARVGACLRAVVDAARAAGPAGPRGGPVVVKVILEESRLILPGAPDPHVLIRQACGLCTAAGADFVKTSSGLALPGATVATVRVMRRHFSGGIKIAGGVSAANVREFLAAASGREDGAIDPDPTRLRVGASGLLGSLLAGPVAATGGY